MAIEGEVTLEALVSTVVEKVELLAVRPLLRDTLNVLDNPRLNLHDVFE